MHFIYVDINNSELTFTQNGLLNSLGNKLGESALRFVHVVSIGMNGLLSSENWTLSICVGYSIYDEKY